MDPGSNAFDILGIDPATADDAGIRRAYAKKIREIRASGRPAEIEKVQRAFEAIRDAEPRERLRKMLAGQETASRLLEEAQAVLASGDPNAARKALRSVLEAVPGHEPVLLQLARIELGLERYDAAVKTTGQLVRAAPGIAGYWVLRCRAYSGLAGTLDAGERQREQLQLALKSLRRAKTLGDLSAPLLVLESEILWRLGSPQAAVEILRTRLAEAQDLRSEEMEVALALLRLSSSQPEGKIFRGTLDTIARLLPDSEERRRTVASALCSLASALAQHRPASAVECARLAEIACPSDPEVERLTHALMEHRTKVEDAMERVAQTEIERRGSKIRFRGVDFGGLWKFILIFMLLRLLLGGRSCSTNPQYESHREAKTVAPATWTEPRKAREKRNGVHSPEPSKWPDDFPSPNAPRTKRPPRAGGAPGPSVSPRPGGPFGQQP